MKYVQTGSLLLPPPASSRVLKWTLCAPFSLGCWWVLIAFRNSFSKHFSLCFFLSHVAQLLTSRLAMRLIFQLWENFFLFYIYIFFYLWPSCTATLCSVSLTQQKCAGWCCLTQKSKFTINVTVLIQHSVCRTNTMGIKIHTKCWINSAVFAIHIRCCH